MKKKLKLTLADKEEIKCMEKIHHMKLKKAFIENGRKVFEWEALPGNYIMEILGEIYGKKKGYNTS